MSLTQNDLRELVEAVWSTTLAIEASVLAAPMASEPGAKVFACVTISGAWNGAVVFESDVAGACHIAGAMLDMDPKQLADDDVRDAIGEVANMIGGNVKALLPQPSALSLPSVARGRDCVVEVAKGHVEARIDIETGGHGVSISLLHTGDSSNVDPRHGLIDIAALVASASQLEPPAPVALELASVLRRDDWELANVARIASHDAAPDRSLLRRANSAAVANVDPVTTVAAAVLRLGGPRWHRSPSRLERVAICGRGFRAAPRRPVRCGGTPSRPRSQSKRCRACSGSRCQSSATRPRCCTTSGRSSCSATSMGPRAPSSSARTGKAAWPPNRPRSSCSESTTPNSAR